MTKCCFWQGRYPKNIPRTIWFAAPSTL